MIVQDLIEELQKEDPKREIYKARVQYDNTDILAMQQDTLWTSHAGKVHKSKKVVKEPKEAASLGNKQGLKGI